MLASKGKGWIRAEVKESIALKQVKEIQYDKPSEFQGGNEYEGSYEPLIN